MTENKGGRPSAYSKDDLKEKLYAYAKEHPEGKIGPSKLAKETGIPYYVWRDRMGAEIKRLNQEAITITILKDTSYEYPNLIAEMLGTNGDEKKMVKLGERFNQLLLDLTGEIDQLRTVRDENSELKERIEDLTRELNAAKEACAEYMRILSVLTVDAFESAEFRQRYGLDNLLDPDVWQRVTGRDPNDLGASEADFELNAAINAFEALDE